MHGSLLMAALIACGAAPDAAPKAPDTPLASVAPQPEAPSALQGPEDLPLEQFSTLETGLEYGVFTAGAPSPIGDSRIHVVRVDPARFRLALLSASERSPEGNHTASGWAAREGAVAAINASMFALDHRTSVFFMANGEHVNNPSFHSDASDVLSFDPVDGAAPYARIVDVNCEDWTAAKARYRSFVQSYRLLDCAGGPTWRENGKIWSHALIGQDSAGRILLLHARSPWSTRAFTEILQALPLDIVRLQYAEGGPEASLFVRTDAFTATRVGSYETGFNENDDNRAEWPLPNVIGVVSR